MDFDPDTLPTFYRRYLGRCNEHRFDELGEFVADDVNGPTEGIAATQRVIRTQELVIYRIHAGKIAECWGDLGLALHDALT